MGCVTLTMIRKKKKKKKKSKSSSIAALATRILFQLFDSFS
jgi:hypothetical protein